MKTIVFLHGFNCGPTIFNYIESKLSGFKIHKITYDSYQSIEESYKEVLKQLPKEKFYLVGHSLGGILGYLISIRNFDLVEKFVSISAPFGGSNSAVAGLFFFPHLKILKDLSPKSKTIKEINKVECNNHLALISNAGSLPFIIGKNDGVVPIKSQLSVKTFNKLFVDANHFEIIQHNDTVRAILNHFS